MRYNKYAFYERAVQSPDHHVGQLVRMYHEIHGKYARVLREDFCGTFQISCEWIRRNRKNEAISLDLDPEPLAYGKRHHRKKLTAEQKRRLTVLKQNVMSDTSPLADIIIAGNFSFYIFKERQQLLKYFRHCYRSLKKGGLVILEMAGGPGMIEPLRERAIVRGRGNQKLFTYVWHQKSFDPITHDAQYSIHFQLPSGEIKQDVFTYDWRLWTITEVREAFLEAGFSEAPVYWETTHKGEGTGEYLRAEKGENDHAWVCYVGGLKG